MKSPLAVRSTVRACLWLIFVYAPVAHAYVDPGSQTLVLQAVLAAIGALVAFVRRPLGLFRAVRRWLRGDREGRDA